MSGETLADGRYKLRELLDDGPVSRVWRAFDTRLRVDRIVRVLTVEPDSVHLLGDAAEAQRRLKRLTHPNLVPVLDVRREGGSLIVVHAETTAGNIEEHVLLHGPLPPAQARTVGLGVLRALEAAQGVAVVHGGLSAESVFIDENEVVRVRDFGVARVTGLPPAPAPEQKGRGGTVDGRTDLWALGALMMSLVGAANERDHARLERQAPELVDFVERCLRRNPPNSASKAAMRR